MDRRTVYIGLGVLAAFLLLAQMWNIKQRSLIGVSDSNDIRQLKDEVYHLRMELDRMEQRVQKAEKKTWTSGYKISRKCSERTNRPNPIRDLDQFPCPGDKEWGKELVPELLSKSPMGPYSKRTCSDEHHCVYENVCIKEDRMYYYPSQEEKDLDFHKFGWEPYRDGGRRTFSWHYSSNKGESWPETVRWINGTNIWYDPSYDAVCHTGHSSEFYNKLVELRHQFPYPVDRILYAFDTELERQAHHAYKYCGYPCNLMRIGFEKEGFLFPKIYWMQEPIDAPHLYHRKYRFTEELLCFERLLVPANEFQHFTSMQAAERHRNAALRMCNITRRAKPSPEDEKKVLFFQRGYGRKLHNAEELCLGLRSSPLDRFQTYLETDDVPDFCQFVATLYSSDIIVTMDGSSNFMLPFARPGSVVIIVHPYNFRVPDWKLMSYYAGLRTLELVTLNKNYSIGGDPNPRWRKGDELIDVWNTTFRDCTHIMCRIAIRNRNTYVPRETLDKFIKRALDLLEEDDNAPRLPCEKPEPWPVNFDVRVWGTPYMNTHWSQYGWENNYDICEPPSPDCHCCNSEECLDATTRMKRPS